MIIRIHDDSLSLQLWSWYLLEIAMQNIENAFFINKGKGLL